MAASFHSSSQNCQLKAAGELSSGEKWSVPWGQECCFQGGVGGEQLAVLWMFVGQGQGGTCRAEAHLPHVADNRQEQFSETETWGCGYRSGTGLIHCGDELGLRVRHNSGSGEQDFGCDILNAWAQWISWNMLEFQSGLFPLIPSDLLLCASIPLNPGKMVTCSKHHLERERAVYASMCLYMFIHTFVHTLHQLLT